MSQVFDNMRAQLAQAKAPALIQNPAKRADACSSGLIKLKVRILKLEAACDKLWKMKIQAQSQVHKVVVIPIGQSGRRSAAKGDTFANMSKAEQQAYIAELQKKMKGD